MLVQGNPTASIKRLWADGDVYERYSFHMGQKVKEIAQKVCFCMHETVHIYIERERDVYERYSFHMGQ